MNRIDFIDELKRSYLDYSMSVIVNRAIPDVRDGCKPVQRRILYSMWENGYVHTKPYKKCSKVIGDVLGKYHPHGETAIYDAMVRMAQDFVMNAVLIDGQGNFGSIDGDNAASTRYTEARLAKISQNLLTDIDYKTVDMIPNYDNSLEMPSVLPVQFPNILINGASGIAVGMATLIPPHNLSEVIDAVCSVIDNPHISVDKILDIIKGPDFPTGGIVGLSNDLRKIYETGRGSFYIRGVAELDDKAITITSIPYQVNKSRLIEQIVDLSEDNTLMIHTVRDESNCDGIRIVIELKKYANSEFVLETLYNKTQFQVVFHANMLAIKDGVPTQMHVLDILQAFISFRETVVIKKSQYLVRNAQARLHILFGMILAISRLDEIISIIKASKSIDDARNALKLMRWDKKMITEYCDEHKYCQDGDEYLSDLQVKAILEMKLQSLTNLENKKLIDETKDLMITVDGLNKILNDRPHRLGVIKQNLLDIKASFGLNHRKTELCVLKNLDITASIKLEDCIIICTQRGYIKRVSLSEYKLQKRGGVGKRGLSDTDAVTHILIANSHQNILFFLSSGYVYSLPAHGIPEGNVTSAGRSILNILPIKKDVKITAMMSIEENASNVLVFVTSDGYVRKNSVKDFSDIRSNGKIAIKLDKNVELCSVIQMNKTHDLFMTSSSGKSVRFAISDIRTFASRTSKGVLGMLISDNDRIVSANSIPKESDEVIYVLSISDKGFGKRTKVSSYRRTNRGTKGVNTAYVDDETGMIAGSHIVRDDGEIILMNNKNQIIRFSVSEIRIANRVTKGVRLSKLPEDETSRVSVSFYHSQSFI